MVVSVCRWGGPGWTCRPGPRWSGGDVAAPQGVAGFLQVALCGLRSGLDGLEAAPELRAVRFPARLGGVDEFMEEDEAGEGGRELEGPPRDAHQVLVGVVDAPAGLADVPDHDLRHRRA